MNEPNTTTRDTANAAPPPPQPDTASTSEAPTPRKLVGLVAGRIVLYVMADLILRPFIVVNPFDGEGAINGILLFDGIFDAKRHVIHLGPDPSGHPPQFAALLSSVSYSEDKLPGTWHFPTREGVVASSVDPQALATQLMGVNENALQKVARELELRFKDAVDERFAANLEAVEKLLEGHKQLLDDLVVAAEAGKAAAASAIDAQVNTGNLASRVGLEALAGVGGGKAEDSGTDTADAGSAKVAAGDQNADPQTTTANAEQTGKAADSQSGQTGS